MTRKPQVSWSILSASERELYVENVRKSASKALVKVSGQFQSIESPVLDVPCGYGRNAVFLSGIGLDITCVDNDRKALRVISDQLSEFGPGKLSPIYCDLIDDPWPFQPESFGAVVNIDFVCLNLFEQLTASLQKGGLLFFETYGNRGANYLQLPRANEVRRLLEQHFSFDFYKEKKAGPDEVDAVTVCLLGRKR